MNAKAVWCHKKTADVTIIQPQSSTDIAYIVLSEKCISVLVRLLYLQQDYCAPTLNLWAYYKKMLIKHTQNKQT